MFGVVFTEKDEIREYRDWAESDHDTYEEVILHLIEKGVMPDKDCREPWFISAAHGEEDAGLVLNAFEEALKDVVG
jgi:glutamate-1-semialdehyde aminotransferase